MMLSSILFIAWFLTAFDDEDSFGVVADLSVSVNSSLTLNSTDSIKLNVVKEMSTNADGFNITLKRQRRSAEIIKRSFGLFAKRLWRGFRRYLEGKAAARTRFGPDRVKKIMMLSLQMMKSMTLHYTATTQINNDTIADEVLPFLKKMEVEPLPAPTTQHPPSIDPNLEQNNQNQTQTLNEKSRSSCHKLREKWKYQLVSENNNSKESAVVSYVNGLSETAAVLYQTLNKRPQKTFLWKTKPGDTPSSDYTTQFKNLYKLALAYGTNGTRYYKNTVLLSALLDGLDFMVTKKGYDGEKYHGDWWHWIIGVPDSFIKIIMIIYDELSQKQRDLYIRVISNYISYPLMTKLLDIKTGAYRMNLAETLLGLGILSKKEDTIILSTETITEVLKPVNEGDGFYLDGSFIQRNDIPYTGLYGKELIKSIAQVLFITRNTRYELDPNVIQSLVEIIDRSFLPLIYEGEMMAMVSGRAISRAQSSTKIGYGSTLLFDLITISKCAPHHSQKKIQEAVKYWMRRNLNYYAANTRNHNDALAMTELLKDESILGDELPFFGVKLFASMDRFVQRSPDYMLGLALHSSRISAFDSGNGENKRGWHTADGMMYLYNDDEVQFNAAYWPTVDPYRLPGTTVDTIHLVDEMLHSRTNSKERWVGGVTNNNQAVVGMSLNKKGTKNSAMLLAMDLRAKKSWFVVDGQIVALGAGITGNTKASIETIIDNRLLNDKFDYSLISNEGLINYPAVAAATLSLKKRKMDLNVKWILLQESAHKASIGYYFPTIQPVTLICERRSGTYFDINDQFMSTHIFSGNYTKLLINHGKNPVNASYAYVILPDITKKGLKVYVETNPVTVIANTEDVQAVKIKDDNYIGINIFKESGANIAGIVTNKPASILKQSKGNQITYVISDPTKSNNTIKVEIPEFTEILRKSEGVEYDGEYNAFMISFVNERHQKFTVRFAEYKQIHSVVVERLFKLGSLNKNPL